MPKLPPHEQIDHDGGTDEGSEGIDGERAGEHGESRQEEAKEREHSTDEKRGREQVAMGGAAQEKARNVWNS